MVMMKNTKVEFYKNGIFSVLKRYDFSPKEKETIQAAILTAKKDIPNMALINKADVLLKQITSERNPKEIPYCKTDIVKMTANAQAKYSSTRTNNAIKMEKHGKRIFMWTFVGALMVSFFTSQIMKAKQPNWYVEEYGLHTYNEAQKICRDKLSTFPSVELAKKVNGESNILTRISENHKDEAFWVEGGNVYSIGERESAEPIEGKKYQARCYDDASSVFR